MKFEITETKGLTFKPFSIVRSYSNSQGKVHLTINLDVTECEASEDENLQDMNTERYDCTNISIMSNSPIKAEEILRLLWKNGMYGHIDKSFLSEFTTIFHIEDYDSLTAMLIGGRYTYAEELACHRKAMNNEMDELMTLNTFVEECKQLAKEVFKKEDK